MPPWSRVCLVWILSLVLGWLVLSPRPALGAIAAPPDDVGLPPRSGAALFAQHCVGCHVNGGNVIRRGKTLRMAALRRAGLLSPEDVARVAAVGWGGMARFSALAGRRRWGRGYGVRPSPIGPNLSKT
jgi:cytochrome c6